MNNVLKFRKFFRVSKNYPKQGITWSVIPSSVYIGGVGGVGGATVAPK